MSFNVVTEYCGCQCPLPTLFIEYKSVAATSGIYYDPRPGHSGEHAYFSVTELMGMVDFESVPWGYLFVARPYDQSYNAGSAPRYASVDEAGDESTVIKTRVRGTYVSKGVPVESYTRTLSMALEYDSSPLGYTKSYTYSEVTKNGSEGDDGDTVVNFEFDLPTPSPLEGGAPAYSVLLGKEAGAPINVLGFGGDASWSKQGFHAFKEEAPDTPVVYRVLTTGAPWSGFQGFDFAPPIEGSPEPQINYSSTLTEEQEAQTSPLFPFFDQTATGITDVSAIERKKFIAGLPERLTINLESEFTTSDLTSRAAAALEQYMASDDRTDTGSIQVRCANVLSVSETSYALSQFDVVFVAGNAPFGTYSFKAYQDEAPTLTAKWTQVVTDAADGTKTVTEGSHALVCGAMVTPSDPLNPAVWACDIEDQTRKIFSAETGTYFEITRFWIDPFPSIPTSPVLSYPVEP